MASNIDPEKIEGATVEEQREVAFRPGARFSDGQSLAEYTTNASEKAGSSSHAESTSGLAHVKAAKAAERKVVRKLGASASGAGGPFPSSGMTGPSGRPQT